MDACHRGHPFVDGSYYLYKGSRHCKECIRLRTKLALNGPSPCQINTAKSHCINGHLLEGDNLHTEKSGSRRCRACRRAAVRKCKYGVSLQVYDRLAETQQHRCAICGQKETVRNRNGQVSTLSVDHNHSTGQVRDLLCRRCNAAVSFMREDVEYAQALVQYLMKWNNK